MTERKKLSDILHGERDKLSSLWKTTVAAAEFAPLPPGEYTFRIVAGELFTSKQKETPGYKLTLEVTEGPHAGRKTWHDLWLTPDALPMTKRDLSKIGVTDPEQLDRPLPAGILIKGRLALRRDEDGNESNRLTRFVCVGVEPPDTFAPSANPDATRADQGDADDATHTPGSNGKPPAEVNGTTTRPKGMRKPAAGTGAAGGTEK